METGQDLVLASVDVDSDLEAFPTGFVACQITAEALTGLAWRVACGFCSCESTELTLYKTAGAIMIPHS